jgi:hypothetical protein
MVFWQKEHLSNDFKKARTGSVRSKKPRVKISGYLAWQIKKVA